MIFLATRWEEQASLCGSIYHQWLTRGGTLEFRKAKQTTKLWKAGSEKCQESSGGFADNCQVLQDYWIENRDELLSTGGEKKKQRAISYSEEAFGENPCFSLPGRKEEGNKVFMSEFFWSKPKFSSEINTILIPLEHYRSIVWFIRKIQGDMTILILIS